MLTSHLTVAHHIWKDHLQPGNSAIDATCGNGYDSLVLIQCPIQHLYCIDIQQHALLETTQRLHHFHHFSTHLCCHSTFQMITHPIHLIVYNLGYLPGSDKTTTTLTETTLQSIKNGLKLLVAKGLMSIMLYPGHAEGAREAKSILIYISTLSHNQFRVRHYRWIKGSKAPTLLLIKKLS